MNPSNCIRDTSQSAILRRHRLSTRSGNGRLPNSPHKLGQTGTSLVASRRVQRPAIRLGYVLRPPKVRACRHDLGWIQIAPHFPRRNPSVLTGTC